MTNRTEILDTAKKIICGEREGAYGSPEKSFVAIANLWNYYLGRRLVGPLLKSSDVANMMILMKIARNMGGVYKQDNWIDIAGYAACGAEVQSMEIEDTDDER